MEDLERIGLLAGAQELDRDAGDCRDREGRAATGVAVDLGQDQPADRDGGDERLGDRDRFLAGHGIDDEERLDRVDGRVDRGDLGHQRLVDGQAAGGVEDDHVADLAPGRIHPAADDVHDRGADGRAVDRDVEALAQRLELVGGGGPIRIRGDEERAATELDDVPGELRARGGLARALEADHRDDSRVARQVESPIAGRQELDELVVDDLDHLLPRRQAVEDVVADRLLADAGDEILDHLEVDVRLEQREPDLAHGGVDVGFADPSAAGQAAEGLAQSIAEGVEHGPGGAPSGGGPDRRRPSRVVREF